MAKETAQRVVNRIIGKLKKEHPMAVSVLSPRYWSIQAKSISVVIAYVLVLCAVYSGFTMYLVSRGERETQERFQQTVVTVAAHLDAYLDSGRKQLVAVAKFPGLINDLRIVGEAQEITSLSVWTTPRYGFLQSPVFTGGLFLLDRNGVVTWTEPPRLPWLGRTLIDAASVARLYTGEHEEVSGGMSANQFFERPHFVMSVPIYGIHGELKGVLGGVVDLTGDELRNFLSAPSLDRAQSIEVRDQQGCILASTESDRLLRCFVEKPLPETVLTTTVKLAQAPWYVLSRQPREIALAEVKRLHHFLWWIGFGMIFLAVNVGGRFVNSFVGSIHRLTAAAKRMASGDLSQPVVIEDRQDELATLADAFERMRVELGRSRAILEQRLKEREAFIRIKEEFLANVSHELRTPLHVIMGYTDILTEQEGDELKLGMLAHIRTKADHLFRLLSDLMMVSGINAGKTSLKIGFVRIADLVEILTSLVDRLRQEKDLRVAYDVPATLPTMETDGLRLEQILSNLVTNAVKFTEHGQISIRIRYASPQDTMIFEITDTGIGIPSKELPFIFDEFHQVDASVSRTYGGMGLGLAVVKKLVDLLQGEITVVSQPGEGSTFTVTLPLRLQVDTPQSQEFPSLMQAVS